MSGANLSGAILPVANFRETKLNNADLSKVLVPEPTSPGQNWNGLR